MSDNSPHQKHLAQAKAQNHNRQAWDELVTGQRCFTRPAKDEDLKDPLHTVDAIGWLGGDIRQQQVLCLAAGGGRQSAIYAAAGAHVTVVDLSPAMLELDRQVAAERGFSIQIVESSMDNLSVFSQDTFDIVIHPVSTCYLPDIQPIFQEVARVIRPQGIYISQHKQPTSLQTNIQRSANGWVALMYRRSCNLRSTQRFEGWNCLSHTNSNRSLAKMKYSGNSSLASTSTWNSPADIEEALK